MQKGFIPIVILITVLILGGLGTAYYFGKLPIKPTNNNPKACTQEAKQCPDGSFVSRTGPNCEFAPCPSSKPTSFPDETANWKTYTNPTNRYLFKYPAEAVIIEDLGTILQFKEPNSPDGVEFAQGYMITFTLNSFENKTLQQIAEADYKSAEELKKNGCFISKPLTVFTINGYSGYNYSAGCQLEGKNIFLSNNKEYFLKIIIQVNEEKKSYQDTIGKILSTFRFIP